MALETNSQFDFFKQIQIDDDGNLLVSIVNNTGSTANFYTTGATLVGDNVYFDRTDELSAYTLSLSAFSTADYYTTGATITNNVAYFDRLDQLSAYTLDLSSYINTDNYTTGATLNGNIASFDRNDMLSAYTLDLSSIAITGDYLPLTGGTMSGLTFQYLDAKMSVQGSPDFILDGGSGATLGFEVNINGGIVAEAGEPAGHHPYKVDLMNSGSAYTFSGEINVLSIGSLTQAITVNIPSTPLRDFYVVKDKTGNAGTYPISISAGSTLINGDDCYIINIGTKPSITFLFDGTEFITI